VSPDGSTVYVTGSTNDPTAGNQYYDTVAYDAATGAKRWVRRFNGRGSDADFATSVGVSPDGSTVFVTGHSSGSGVRAYTTVAYDAASGSQLWATRYEGAGFAYVDPDLAVSSDGSAVFLSGIGGSTPTWKTRDYATVAYDASTGVQLWERRYDGGDGPDFPSALGVSPDGSAVYVTGRSDGRWNPDYATVAYDAVTGATLWVRRFDGAVDRYGDDYGRALAVSPDGSAVFVTGDSIGSGSRFDFDFVTLAYSAA
jgi:hypothetical protein